MSILNISKMLVRSLLRGPSTRRYPFVAREPFAATRGGVDVDPDTCILCMLCQKKCPTGAITVDRPGQNLGNSEGQSASPAALASSAVPRNHRDASPLGHRHDRQGQDEVFPIAFVPPPAKPAVAPPVKPAPAQPKASEET